VYVVLPFDFVVRRTLRGPPGLVAAGSDISGVVGNPCDGKGGVVNEGGGRNEGGGVPGAVDKGEGGAPNDGEEGTVDGLDEGGNLNLPLGLRAAIKFLNFLLCFGKLEAILAIVVLGCPGSVVEELFPDILSP